MSVVSIKWFPEASGSGGHLELLDQTKLPLATHWIKCSEAEVVVEAIKRLAVRGAPAIGIAGAYAYCLAAQQAIVDTSGPDGVPRDCRGFTDRIVAQAALIAAARPTAVNLQWAVDRMNRVLSRYVPARLPFPHSFNASGSCPTLPGPMTRGPPSVACLHRQAPQKYCLRCALRFLSHGYLSSATSVTAS